MIERLRSFFVHPRKRYRSVLRNREGGRTILFLIGALLAAAAVLFVIGRIDTVRRSGTAIANIVGARFQAPDPFAQTPQGSHLQYEYVVDGHVYLGADFRQWTDVAAHEPKVCYEPADPTNHLLVDGRIRCGVDPGP